MGSLGESVVVEKDERSAPSRKLKRVAQWMFGLAVFPRLAAYRLAQLVLGRDRAFSAASESIARIPGTRGVYARQAFYRRTLADCGRDVYFGWLSVFSSPEASVGDQVFIGRRCNFGCVRIGSKTLISDGVQVLSGSGQHGMNSEESFQDQRQRFVMVDVGSNVWLGSNAVVMANVGADSVIGAGAVVTRAVPERTLALGVPARPSRTLD